MKVNISQSGKIRTVLASYERFFMSLGSAEGSAIIKIFCSAHFHPSPFTPFCLLRGSGNETSEYHGSVFCLDLSIVSCPDPTQLTQGERF